MWKTPELNARAARTNVEAELLVRIAKLPKFL